MERPTRPVVRHVDDCTTEQWSSPERGTVAWWELIGGDITATDEMTVGIAEIPVGAVPPPRGHRHDATEVYVIMSGTGEVVIDGIAHPVRPQSAVWIPADAEHYAHNTGDEPLRLVYVFARDKFSDVHYEFPSA
jgi:mannose-6-phosphate isomerase-like protein (cupin superfamily)